jgi:hypothetical protein
MVKTTRAQREALWRVFQRDFPNWLTPSHQGSVVKVPSVQYRPFRAQVHSTSRAASWCRGPVCGWGSSPTATHTRKALRGPLRSIPDKGDGAALKAPALRSGQTRPRPPLRQTCPGPHRGFFGAPSERLPVGRPRVQ